MIEVWHVAADVACSVVCVCVSVCLGIRANWAKTDEPVETPFGTSSRSRLQLTALVAWPTGEIESDDAGKTQTWRILAQCCQ